MIIQLANTKRKHMLAKINEFSCKLYQRDNTVQAIRNITNFFVQKIHTNSCEFVRISYLNSCTKFAKNSSTNSCVNSRMNSCTNSYLKITFLRKRIEIQYVDIIKDNILIEIILQAVC